MHVGAMGVERGLVSLREALNESPLLVAAAVSAVSRLSNAWRLDKRSRDENVVEMKKWIFARR